GDRGGLPPHRGVQRLDQHAAGDAGLLLQLLRVRADGVGEEAAVARGAVDADGAVAVGGVLVGVAAGVVLAGVVLAKESEHGGPPRASARRRWRVRGGASAIGLILSALW